MDRFYKMMKRNNKGFTLVELMVVLLILGILVAIAIPIYNNVTGKANRNAIAANLRTIDGAIMQYLAVEDTTPANAAALQTGLDGKYIQTWPADDPKGTEYSVVSEGTTYKAQVKLTSAITGVGAAEATFDLAQIKDLMD
jgi:prepilin-type N-terminal cleavage/methylation domain-containing protein